MSGPVDATSLHKRHSRNVSRNLGKMFLYLHRSSAEGGKVRLGEDLLNAI